MASEERLPPACTFAISVLAERDVDPDAVPEEAVEAVQHPEVQEHLLMCASSCMVLLDFFRQQASVSMKITSTVADPLVLGVQGDGTMEILN